MMQTLIRPLFKISLLALVVGLLLTPVAEAQNPCSGVSKSKRIERIGGPNAFAAPVNTVAELQERMDTLRPEVEHVLEKAGISTDVILAFFDAIESGENIEEGSIQRGESFDWMAFRTNGKPRLAKDLCFAIPQAEPSFVVKVPLKDQLLSETVSEVDGEEVTTRVYQAVVFDIPKKCSNISIKRGSTGEATERESRPIDKPAPDPVAQLTAGRDCDDGAWDLGTAGSVGELQLTATNVETGESQQIPLNSGSFSGPDSESAQDYRFTLTATNADGVSATAEASVAGCPRCDISVTPSTALAGAPITVEVDGNWAANGLDLAVYNSAGDEVASIPSGAAPVSETLKLRRQGIYTVRGTATNEDNVQSAECSAEFATESRLTLRGFAAFGDPTGDEFFASNQRSASLQERQKFNLSNGTGYGVSLEYLLNRRVGIEAGYLFIPLDSMFTLDLNDAWGMQNQDVDWSAFTAGVNFHLVPDARADVYVGPFLAFTNYSDATYNVLGETYNLDFDSSTDFGLQLGVDYPFTEGSPWNLHAGARYIPSSSVDVKGALEDFELDVDPTILSLGISYKF